LAKIFRMSGLNGVPGPLRHGPFTVEQAQALGVSLAQLRGQRYRKLFRGVYAASTFPDTLELRCRALLLVLPGDAVFSHFTAAELYGLPANDPLIHVSTSSPQRRPGPRTGVRLHESVSDSDVRAYDGLPITTPERTFIDLAPRLELVDLVIFGDAMLRRVLTSRSSLSDALGNAAGRRGVCRAREAAGLMRDGVDSPMESRLRLLLVFAGLPCPEINVDIFDEHGHWLSRPDLCYRGIKLALEYEGDTHRTDKRQWRADMSRHVPP
jgi:hypothetical protein